MGAKNYRVRIKWTQDAEFVIRAESADDACEAVGNVTFYGEHDVVDWENAYGEGEYEIIGEPVEVPRYPIEDVDIVTPAAGEADKAAEGVAA